MSSLPGLSLEAFLMWQHDLIVEDLQDANASLRIAEALGRPSGRVRLTQAQFAPMVKLAEPYREQVEYWLINFDEENQSWRDYGGSLDWMPDSVADAIEKLKESYVKPTAAVEKTEPHWSSDLPAGAVFGAFSPFTGS